MHQRSCSCAGSRRNHSSGQRGVHHGAGDRWGATGLRLGAIEAARMRNAAAGYKTASRKNIAALIKAADQGCSIFRLQHEPVFLHYRSAFLHYRSAFLHSCSTDLHSCSTVLYFQAKGAIEAAEYGCGIQAADRHPEKSCSLDQGCRSRLQYFRAAARTRIPAVQICIPAVRFRIFRLRYFSSAGF